MSDAPSPSSQPGDPGPEPSRLEIEPEERRRIRPWLLALIGVFVGYPLSVGPVVWLFKTLDPDEHYAVYFVWIFAPLEFLHRTVPSVHAFYDWYLSFFGRG